MHVFEVVIALLLGGALLALVARRLGTPTPVLDPELALALFVAPVLLDAAFDSSLRDLRWSILAGGGSGTPGPSAM